MQHYYVDTKAWEADFMRYCMTRAALGKAFAYVAFAVSVKRMGGTFLDAAAMACAIGAKL